MSKLSYNDKMRAIRRFVNFNYDLRHDLATTLTTKQKAEISRYYKQLLPAITQNYVVYTPKRADNIKAARDITGQKLSKLKAFAIHSPTGQGRARPIKKDGVIVGFGIEKEGAFVRTLYADMREMILNTRPYLDALLDDKKRYLINSGGDWLPDAPKRRTIERIIEIIAKYDWVAQLERDEDPDAEYDENDGEKPIFQINFIEIDIVEKATRLEYIKARNAAKDDKKKKARAAYRKAYYDKQKRYLRRGL